MKCEACGYEDNRCEPSLTCESFDAALRLCMCIHRHPWRPGKCNLREMWIAPDGACRHYVHDANIVLTNNEVA